MKRTIYLALLAVAAVACFAQTAGKERLPPDVTKGRLIGMDPAMVDPSDLPLDRIDQFHATGVAQEIKDISSWRLAVTGKGLEKDLSLGYGDLMALPMVKKKVLLICQGVFADYGEWEGVALSVLLKTAKARPDFTTVSFKAYDGYTERFSREEAANHLLFLAVKVNGLVLPQAHGYPVRLVAEDFYGNRWVKWIKEIRVE
jgi:DMSO/TMAO reductase YedYZ molybdopterin-dependent catalytic subunit